MGLKRITLHWTAGSRQHKHSDRYHFSVDHLGGVWKGDKPPESNLSANVARGSYMAHCGGGNSDNIGIALMGMAGFRSRDNAGPFPLTTAQVEAGCKLIAQLSIRYNIPVTSDTIFTHYEFGLKHPSSSSAGKIDIVFLPPFPDVPRERVGDFLRQKVRWYRAKELEKTNGTKKTYREDA